MACQTPSNEDSLPALARKCFAAPIWIAFWGFLFGGNLLGRSSFSLPIAITVVAGLTCVSITSIICGTVLAARSQAPTPRHEGYPKDVFDPETFDTVARRG